MKKFENKYDKRLQKLDSKYQNRKYKNNIITDFGKYEDEHSKIVDEYLKNRKYIEKAKKIVDKINKNNKKIQLKKERLNKALDYQKETKNKSSSKISTDKEYKKMQNDFKKIIRDDYENNEKLISFTKNELKNEQSKEGKKILKQTLNKLNEDKKKFQKDLDDIDNRSDFYTKEYFKNKRN